MATARKGGSVQSKISMLLFGDKFTGKSTMASQICYFKRPDGKPFRVLYLDPESGSIDDYCGDLEANGVNMENLYIVYTQSLAEVREYISKAKNKEDFYVIDEEGNETSEVVLDADGEPFRPDAIVIDGTTILNLSLKQGLIEFSKKRNSVKAKQANLTGDEKLVKIEGSGLEIKDYGTINFKGQDLILDLMGSGLHFIVTARETDEKVSVKDSEGKITSVVTGNKIPDGFKDIGYNCKTVVRMFRNKDDEVCAYIDKDRTHVFEDKEIVVNPTLCSWQSVIDKTAKNKAFTVKNSLTESVETERKLYQKEIEKSVGTVTTEELKSETVEETAVVEDEIVTLKKQIKKVISGVSPANRPVMQEKVKESGLPLDYTKYTSVDDLKKFLEIIQ